MFVELEFKNYRGDFTEKYILNTPFYLIFFWNGPINVKTTTNISVLLMKNLLTMKRKVDVKLTNNQYWSADSK